MVLEEKGLDYTVLRQRYLPFPHFHLRAATKGSKRDDMEVPGESEPNQLTLEDILVDNPSERAQKQVSLYLEG